MDITTVTVAAIITSGIVSLGAFSAWLRHRAGRGARDQRADRFEGLADDVQALHASLEALALEVERLGEGQRYTLRLLDGHREPAAPRSAAPERVLTPR